jgi:UDP-GlcNAc3NAcA epimerase
MHWLSIVGARPQFVKVSAVCRALTCHPSPVFHEILHTGQHYDDGLSGSFFRDLDIPAPAVNLGVGSGSHGVQTAAMIELIERELTRRRPDWVLLYGDTNSTLAGAVAASKLPDVRVAHVEAGLRSYNRRMPEEINRVAADHLSHLLLCPTSIAVQNLKREGLDARAVVTGDIMFDVFVAARQAAAEYHDSALEQWRHRQFALATLHRQENTTDGARLRGILTGLELVSRDVIPVVLPLHPGTRRRIVELGWHPKAITVLEPVSYLAIVQLVSSARLVLTDSGGLQKEAYFAERPCVTLRDETEWVETLRNECNVLAGSDPDRILAAARSAAAAGPWSPFFGDGRAGEACVDAILAAS